MKKSIKWVGIVLGTIFTIGIPFSLLAQKVITIETVQWINASKEVVYDQIRFMENFPSWSPFIVQDPNQKNYVTGQDGEVGATFHWEGVNEKSQGSQTVTLLKVNEQVYMECNIEVPFKANPTFDYQLVEKDGGVEVTQTFTTEMAFPGNVFAAIFGVKKKMSETNKLGLERLKYVSEEKIASVTSN